MNVKSVRWLNILKVAREYKRLSGKDITTAEAALLAKDNLC